MTDDNDMVVAPSELEATVTNASKIMKELPTGNELEMICIEVEGRERPLEFAIFRQKEGKHKGKIQPFCPGGKLLSYLARKKLDTIDLSKLEGYRMKFEEKEDKRGFRNWHPDWEYTPEKEYPGEQQPEEKAEAPSISGDTKALYDFICKAGDGGVPEDDLLREVKNNRPKLDKLLNQLMDDGRVYEVEDGVFGGLVK